jgi:RNA polymerase sigma factor (TIGR02999 family)
MDISNFTQLLNSDQKELSSSEQKDMEDIYQQLKHIAKSQKFKIKINGLNTTALVNETWLKTKDTNKLFNDRNHFFAYCSIAMRHILINQARKNKLITYIENDEKLLEQSVYYQFDYLLDLDRQLEKLKQFSPRLEQIFTYRFFAEMEFNAIAEHLKVSERTVIRDWKKARIMLSVALKK